MTGGLPVDAGSFLELRARGSVWRRGPTFCRVTHCCLEHAGQTFGFPTEAPGQPAVVESIGKEGVTRW